MKPNELYAEAQKKSVIDDNDARNECQTGYYFAFARNMVLPEGWHKYDEKRRAQVGDHIVQFLYRAYVALKIGGRLALDHHMDGGDWIVMLYHRDGTTEPVYPFRRRKRAEAWIANMYLYTFTP